MAESKRTVAVIESELVLAKHAVATEKNVLALRKKCEDIAAKLVLAKQSVVAEKKRLAEKEKAAAKKEKAKQKALAQKKAIAEKKKAAPIVSPEPAAHYLAADPNARSTDPTQLYMREIGFKPLLSAKDELKVARQVVKRNKKARTRMIESNLRLVIKIARNYLNRGLAFLDIIEEGNMGLMTAVEKFDPERGFRFSTYATWWIRQTIERAIMNQSRTVRLPIHVIKELNVYLRAAKKLSSGFDHAPTNEEIAELIDKPVDDIRRMMDLAPDTTSLDVPTSRSNDAPLVDSIAGDASDDPAVRLLEHDFGGRLERMINELDERHREVLIRRFGLFDHEKGTLEAVGREVGLTRERVRQLQLEAVDQLKKKLLDEGDIEV